MRSRNYGALDQIVKYNTSLLKRVKNRFIDMEITTYISGMRSLRTHLNDLRSPKKMTDDHVLLYSHSTPGISEAIKRGDVQCGDFPALITVYALCTYEAT